MFVSDSGPSTSTEQCRAACAPPQDLSLGELDREIATLAAHINAATCRWLTLVSEFDRRRGHEEFGFVSCAAWLAWRCSITARAARDQLRVARSLDGLPRIREAFGSGSLSYSKVRALSRVAEPEMEPELLELALEATAAQLERLIRGYRGAIAADPHARAAERRHLSTSWDEDGALVIRGSLPAEEGALFLKALELAGEELKRERGTENGNQAGDAPPGGRPDTVGARAGERNRTTNADALLAVAETAVAGGVRACSGGDRHQVTVHVDLDALAAVDGAENVGGEVGDSISIPAETVRRLACDASVVTLVERDGKPLSVGRKSRSVPPSIARALRTRDRGCRFPGCERDRFVDAHHIEHWAHGGETSIDNLVQLCRHHHRLVHEGGFTVERRHGALEFRRPDGRAVPDLPPPVAETVANLVARVPAAGSHDCGPRSRGEPMDLDLSVFALASLREGRGGQGNAVHGSAAHGNSGGDAPPGSASGTESARSHPAAVPS